MTTLGETDFPHWFAVLLEQLSSDELTRFLRQYRYHLNGLDIQAAILRIVEDLRRQESNAGRADKSLTPRLLGVLREYIDLLD